MGKNKTTSKYTGYQYVDAFKPTHMLMRDIPVAMVDEGWSGREVPDLDGVPLPFGLYTEDEWERDLWPAYRMSRDGRIAAYCETWVHWTLDPIKKEG